MNKEKMLSLGLTEDQATAILEAFKGYVPPERFNEVNEAKKRAEELVSEREKQIDSLKKSAGDNDALKAQIEKLQGENKAAKEKYESDLKTLRIDNAINAALTASGAKNLKAARALLNMDEISIDGENVKGIDSQIKKLIADESSSFLFNVKPADSKIPTGMKAGEGNGKIPTKPVNEMNYSERVAFLNAGGKL